MKKKLLLAFAALAVVFAVPASSFAVDNPAVTQITGTVSSAGSPVGGANVQVTCGSVSGNDTTDSEGVYLVTFAAADCPKGSTTTAAATKGDASGSNSGTANKITNKLNIALVDVDVAVPEMGTIVGGIAALGAGGAFLIIRKRQQQAQL